MQLASDQAEMARDFSNFRTRTLGVWTLTNILLVGVVLHSTGLNRFGEGLAIILFWNLGMRFMGMHGELLAHTYTRLRGRVIVRDCCAFTPPLPPCCPGSLFYQCGRCYKNRIRQFVQNVYGISVDESIRVLNERNTARKEEAMQSRNSRLSPTTKLALSQEEAAASIVDQEVKMGDSASQLWIADAPIAPPAPYRGMPMAPPTRSHLESVFDFDSVTDGPRFPVSPRRTLSRSDPLLYPDDWRRTSEPAQYYDRTPYLLNRDLEDSNPVSRSFVSDRTGGSGGRAPGPKPVRKIRRIVRKMSSKRRPSSGADTVDSEPRGPEHISKDVRNLAKTISTAVKAELSMALSTDSPKSRK